MSGRVDVQLVFVLAETAGEFAERVNAHLKQGCWRVEQTEMSVTDAHYFAMLVRAAPDSGLASAFSNNTLQCCRCDHKVGDRSDCPIHTATPEA